jgi:hypothetical protein
MLLDNLEQLYEQLPELIYGSNLEALGGRVYATQGRTERYHLQVGILLEEETTLQACVDSAYLRLCGKEAAVALYRSLKQL